MNSRAVAVRIIAKWLDSGSFPDREVSRVREARAFVTELVYGAVKRKRALEWIIGECASENSASTRTVPYLLVGLYQLFFMSDVEEYAAVNETVQAAKGRLPAGAIKFVNAILRRATREKEQLLGGLSGQGLEVRVSHPDYLVDKWIARFGEEDTARLCEWNNRSPRVTIRINRLKVSTEEYLALAGDAEIDIVPHDHAPDRCLVVPRGHRINTLPGYDDGLFSVQDPSMVVPVDMLGIEPGDDVLDACAAPGGKAVQIAEAMKGKGTLTCMDLHQDRLDRLAENLERMKITAGLPDTATTSLVYGDAAKAGEVLEGRKFDRVLVDVPCTNTGVLQRRADARWRVNEERVARMATMQVAILDGVSRVLKKGGVLVYSTCSLENEECGALVAEWLGRRKAFELVSDRILFPPDSRTDGIYAAAIRCV